MDQFRRLASSAKSDPNRRDVPLAAAPDPGSEAQRGDLVTERLSEKEEKILQLICEGMMNRQIGNALFLAEGTVKNYVSRIMEKLHANTRTELAVLSRRHSRPP
jgi:DNA-binding NarL/FixJ family response regulator